MIGSEFYRGQGFGNQLWVYAYIKSVSKRKNLDFGFIGHDEFKGSGFMNLDLGNLIKWPKSKLPNQRIPTGFTRYEAERKSLHPEFNWELNGFQQEFYDLRDGTFVDGCFQAEQYLSDFKEDFTKTMKVVGEEFDGCLIHFRAGDYVKIKDVFLPPTYYYDAIERMKSQVPGVKFKIVTDGPKIAAQLFPGIPIESSGSVRVLANRWYFQQKKSSIGVDFGRIQNARHLILSNSSFSWWGAWTNSRVENVIAPKYWTKFNVSDGYWGLKDSLTKNWLWLDRNSNFFSYDECLGELQNYRTQKNWA
jgi:hypothetical protein